MDKEKCLQLKMYENDVQKMFDWIKSNRDLFMLHYVKLGHNAQEAKDLQEQHSFFCAGSMNVYVNISRLQQAAASLIESRHYAAGSIHAMSEKLEKCWADFASSLDQRAAVLKLAVEFYSQAEQYLQNVHRWKTKCELTGTTGLPCNVNELEELVHEHQKLYDTVNSAHSDLHAASKKLLLQLEQFIGYCYQRKFIAGANGPSTSSSSSSSLCSSGSSTNGATGSNPTASRQRNSYTDYAEASKPILQTSAELLAAHRSLDCVWQAKKLKLHQRLALALFQEDVRQVIEWVDTHGEGFLRKHIGVGRSLARATQLQESHEHFEAVAANTYTNAEKLLIAAEEFAQTGECNADEIYAVAQRLEQNISRFAKRVERRRYTLQLAVLFYKHATDLNDWFDRNGVQWEAESKAPFKAPNSLVLCEQQVKQVLSERGCMLDAAQDTITEGQTLLEELSKQKSGCTGDVCDSSSSKASSSSVVRRNLEVTASETLIAKQNSDISTPVDSSVDSCMQAIQTTLDKVHSMQKRLKDLLGGRKLRVELCLQLRLLEKDAYQSCKQFDLYSQELGRLEQSAASEMSTAEKMLQLHGESSARIQSAAFDVIQRGQEFLRVLESYSSSFVITATPALDCSIEPPTVDAEEIEASERVKSMLELLQQRETEFEEVCELGRNQLEQAVQLCQFEIDAKQVISWMRNGESMLAASYVIPTCLQEAEDLQAEYEQFQLAFEKTHSSAFQLHQRADLLIQNHPNSGDQVRSIVEQVSRRWQLLMTHAEDRHKLMLYATNFFKTVQQVLLVLDSLAKQYATDEDFCGASSWNISGGPPDITVEQCVGEKKIAQAISKHQEHKEGFLKACTLARRNAETFIKYASRCSVYSGHASGAVYRSAEGRVKHILEHILQQENRALECWARRKRRLDQCQQYVLVEHSARQALRWIHETGDHWLAKEQRNDENSGEETLKQAYKALQNFCLQVRETKEKVRLLVQLSENLIERRHVHCDAIRYWYEKVEQQFADFTVRLERYEKKLQRALGIMTSNDIRSPASDSVTSQKLRISSRSESSEDDQEQLLRVASLSLQDSPSSSSTQDNESPLSGSTNGEMDTETGFMNNQQMEMRRKWARKRDFIMGELLRTERTYVADLCTCIQTFFGEYECKDREGQLPKGVSGKSKLIFGNIQQIYAFHKDVFLKELEKYETMPEDVGHCFVTWARSFDIYVSYCKNMPDSNTQLLQPVISNFFEQVKRDRQVPKSISDYLIRPVQRITKYQLLLKDLLGCCEPGLQGEVKDALEVMIAVPRKANDAMHLSQLDSVGELDWAQLGEVLLQDSFQLFDSRSLLPSRKGRYRRVFLFESYLVFAKEVKQEMQSAERRPKYVYKSKLLTSEIGLTEHVEGDENKFAIWTIGSGTSGRANPVQENKIILKSPSIEVKQQWVKKLRELMQDNYFSTRLSTLNLTKNQGKLLAGNSTPASSKSSLYRDSREFENNETAATSLSSTPYQVSFSTCTDRKPEGDYLSTGNHQESQQAADRNSVGGCSVASFSSSNTTDSDKR